MTRELTFPRVPKTLINKLRADSMVIANEPSKRDETVGHIQLLSNKIQMLKGNIYYISEQESMNQMGEPTVKVVPHYDFNIDDMIGDIIFIKFKEENKGKLWKLRPTVKVETLESFPKTLFGSNTSIKTQLTIMQKRFLDIDVVEMEENDDIWFSTILVNQKNFVFRDGHKYTELYYDRSDDYCGWKENEVYSREDFEATTPGFCLDTFRGEIIIHIFNPYYFDRLTVQ